MEKECLSTAISRNELQEIDCNELKIETLEEKYNDLDTAQNNESNGSTTNSLSSTSLGIQSNHRLNFSIEYEIK